MTKRLDEKQVEFKRKWAMPNHKTFNIKPIKKFNEKHLGQKYTDTFPHPYDRDALQLLKSKKTNSVDRLAFDPVYSLRQLKEKYQSKGISLTQHETQYYWSDLRQEIGRIVEPGGIVISYGWNSCGIGKTKGFEIIDGLLVCHGGHHNDTICTVERKIQETLT